MRKNTLINVNPNLRDPNKYEKALVKNVLTSTAIEIGKVPESIIKSLTERKTRR